MSSQVDTTGFTFKTEAEIRDELAAAYRVKFGDGIKTDPASAFGRMIDVQSNIVARDQDLALSVYLAVDPNQNFGISQDSTGQVVGVTRLAASKSTATGTLDLDAVTTVPAGSVVSVVGNPTARFLLLADVTSVGAGTYDGEFEAEAFGPTEATAGSLTVIETPVAGWNTVTNALDADLGRNVETDTEFRLRRLESTQISGKSTVGAVRAKVGEVTDVEFARVIENDLDVDDAAGRQAHSIEVITFGGDQQTIANVIWNDKGGGIRTVSTAAGPPELLTSTVTDSEGFTHTVVHTAAEELEIHLDVNLTITETLTAAESDAIKADVAALGNLLRVGDDVVLFQLQCVDAITSNTKITDIFIEVGIAPAPTQTTNFIVGDIQIARFDTTRIDVSTVVTP